MGYHIRPTEPTPIYEELRITYDFENALRGIMIVVPDHPTRDDIDWGDYWLPTLGRRPVSLPNI